MRPSSSLIRLSTRSRSSPPSSNCSHTSTPLRFPTRPNQSRSVSGSTHQDYRATESQANKLKAKGRDEEGHDVREKDETVPNEEFLSHKKNEVSLHPVPLPHYSSYFQRFLLFPAQRKLFCVIGRDERTKLNLSLSFNSDLSGLHYEDERF